MVWSVQSSHICLYIIQWHNTYLGNRHSIANISPKRLFDEYIHTISQQNLYYVYQRTIVTLLVRGA